MSEEKTIGWWSVEVVARERGTHHEWTRPGAEADTLITVSRDGIYFAPTNTPFPSLNAAKVYADEVLVAQKRIKLADAEVPDVVWAAGSVGGSVTCYDGDE